MNLLKTLQTNWRDILVGLALVFSISFFADVIEKLSATENGLTWLSNLSLAMAGVARFFGANLVAWIGLAVAWPTLNKYSNDTFDDGWKALPTWGRFVVFVGVSCALLIAAALCFTQ